MFLCLYNRLMGVILTIAVIGNLCLALSTLEYVDKGQARTLAGAIPQSALTPLPVKAIKPAHKPKSIRRIAS